MDITPVNNHLIIEPLKHSSLLPSEKGTYDEVGIVLAKPWWKFWWAGKGQKVWFDSWLGSKHPTGESDEYFWLVKWKDVKAYGKNEISK